MKGVMAIAFGQGGRGCKTQQNANREKRQNAADTDAIYRAPPARKTASPDCTITVPCANSVMGTARPTLPVSARFSGSGP